MFLYLVACLVCFLSNESCVPKVVKTSSNLSKLLSAARNLSSASCLLECSPVIPAASSSKSLRSVDLALMIAQIRPWLTKPVDLAPVA